jgi:hypothetical protein
MWYLSDAEENRRGFWERFPIIPLFITGPMGSLHPVPGPAPTERCSWCSQWQEQQEEAVRISCWLRAASRHGAARLLRVGALLS